MLIIRITIIFLFGCMLHFLYEISNHNKVVALFAAVNESTWEHIKIALTPIFLYSLYDFYIYGLNPNYMFAKLTSILSCILLIPIIFYTYKYFTKKAILIIDIITFFIVICVSQIIFDLIINLNALPFIYTYLSLILLFIIFGFYMVLTLRPIKNEIFKDPISNKYGISGHTEMHKHTHKKGKN